MFSKALITLAAALSTASATYQGFNYGSGLDYSTSFALAKSLVGTSGDFTSARLYTMIEQGSVNTPTSAIPAAIANDVTLLLGLWASGGQADLDDEIAALTAAISTYGTAFTSRVAAISVGSEDLYRISPTGVINKSGVGAEPDTIVDYINQVRSAIAGTTLSGALVGHVDTWTAWVNGSNDAVISACDFIGMDAYPYFQNTQVNAITDAYDLFFSAYDQTVAATNKPVWVTETGWPTLGNPENDAVPSVANAQIYWDQVACKLLGATNTYWYTLDDAGASPSFGLTDGSSTPIYDLACSASSSSSSSSASSTASSASSTSTGVSASTTATSSVASSSASSSVAPLQTSVPVSSSAVASGGGSPGDTTSASADSSAASFASASSAAYSSAVASASSAVASASSAVASASAASTETTASSAASASIASASSAASAASSEIAASSSVAVSPSAATTETVASSATIASIASASSAASAASAASSEIAASSSVAASTIATETASGTSTGTATVASYTGAASTVRSTGGFVAALFAVLAFL